MEGKFQKPCLAKKGLAWRFAAMAVSVCLTGILLGNTLTAVGFTATDRYDDTGLVAQGVAHVEEQLDLVISSLSVDSEGKKVYRLNDKNLIAPKPDPAGYGTAASFEELSGVLDGASSLLDGQKLLLTEETPIMEHFGIRYYYDETILALVWKQGVDGCMYTFSEVKIAHPTQIRRFLSEGRYGSGVLYTTTEMAKSVNAVVASSGDYYQYRSFGVVVNEGTVYRAKGELLDTCYIDNDGNLLFTRAKELNGQEEFQKFVDENHVRFSLSFGPVMVENGELCAPAFYNSGEIGQGYARAALGQMDSLHYVLVTANMEEPCYNVPTVGQFAENLWEMGIPTAYALDGGQTAALVMDQTLINKVSYGSEREISDILYFATAIPE